MSSTNVTPTDPQGAGETRVLLKPDGSPVTDADFPGADDAFRVTLTLKPITRIAVREDGV